jgi:hypothetical protein
MNTRSFWIRLFVGGALFLFSAHRLLSQSAPINFDALPRANKPAAAEPVVAKAPTKPAPVAKPRVDTVRVSDTVRVTVVRVDTVKVATPAPFVAAKPVTPAPAPKAVAVAGASVIAGAPATTPVVNGLFQFQATGGDSLLKATYRVRRAEVKVATDLGHKVQAIMMVDVAKALSLTTAGTTTSVTQSSRVLQDAYVVVPVGKTSIEAGQQRLPLSYEGSFGSSTLETIDRALMESDRARGGAFGDLRDLGVAARGKWRALDYRGGLFNGSGESMNETDKNVGKTFAAQLGVRPTFVKGLRIGASGATSGSMAGDKPVRDRVGADLLYTKGRLHLQAEAMGGQDATTHRFGGYALAGVQATPWVKLIARFDAWDPDVSKETLATNVTERDYLAGLTWFPPGTRLKVQAAFVRKTYTRDITPAVRQVLTQVQASW